MADVDNDSPELAAAYDRASDSQYESGLQLIALMGICEGDHVLDVGCGTGRLALYVAGVVWPSGRVFGLDPSPHRVQVAGDKPGGPAAGNVAFGQGIAEELGRFSDASFDAVYFNAVFHWVGDKKAALREAYRVLKPGGTVGITTGSRGGPSTIRDVARAAFPQGPRRQGQGAPRASMWLTKDELASLFGEAGLADVGVEQRTAVKYFQSPGDYFRWLEASAPGRRTRAPGHVRAEIRRRMAEALEQRRTPEGIEIRSGRLLAIARRP